MCPSQIIPVGIHTGYWTFLWPCAWWSPLRLPRWVYGYQRKPSVTQSLHICDTEPAHLWNRACTSVTQSQRNSHRNMAMTLLCSCFTLERQCKCDTLGLTHAPSIIWYSSALQVHFIARTCCKDGSTTQYSTDVTWCWCKPLMIYDFRFDPTAPPVYTSPTVWWVSTNRSEWSMVNNEVLVMPTNKNNSVFK